LSRQATRHQGRRRKAEYLPERKIPGHDGEDRPQRLVGGVTIGRIGFDPFRGQEVCRPVGVELARPYALFDLGSRLRDGLAHLGRYQAGIDISALVQQLGSLPHQDRAVLEGPCLPRTPRHIGMPQHGIDIGPGHGLVVADLLARRRIDACNRHSPVLRVVLPYHVTAAARIRPCVDSLLEA
jgi:hypothetical protein